MGSFVGVLCVLSVLKGEHSMTTRVRKMKFPFQMKRVMMTQDTLCCPNACNNGARVRDSFYARTLAEKAVHGIA